jgi:peroxiredoxin
VVQLHRERSRLEGLGAKVFVVTFDQLWRALEMAKSGEIPFPVLLDPERGVYSAYELERSYRRSLHPRTLWFYFKKMLRGRGFSKITADPTQLGGDFLVDNEGIIRFVYYSEDPTDRPTVEQIISALEKI